MLPGIGVSVKQDALAHQSVAARPADLLVIAFQGFGISKMHHQPHVGFVDAHAKGDRRHDDVDFVFDKQFLDQAPFFGAQPGMVSPGPKHMGS